MNTCSFERIKIVCIFHFGRHRIVMEVALVTIGGPVIWQCLCMLESVSSIISVESESVSKLTEHICKLREYLSSIGGQNLPSTLNNGQNSEIVRSQCSLNFFESLKIQKLQVIDNCKEIEMNLKQQISSVIEQQPYFQ